MTPFPKAQGSDGRKVTILGACVNLFLIFFKFLVGFFGRSQALIADAVHSISDLFTDAAVLFGLSMSQRAPDETHHFGHGRFDTLSSAVVGMALIGVSLYLGIQASMSIYRHAERHPTWLALGAAAVSIALKELLYRYTMHVGRDTKSPAIIANAWHHRSDALSSVAVLLGVGGAQIRPDWHILDAYAALVVSFLILKVGIQTLWACTQELTDAAPDPRTSERIRSCASNVEGVLGLHDVKIRSSGGLYQMELHVVVDGNITVREGHEIAKEVERCLQQEFKPLGQVIVHVDPSDE